MGIEERELEGKGVIPQKLWSQDSLSDPPAPPSTHPSTNSKNYLKKCDRFDGSNQQPNWEKDNEKSPAGPAPIHLEPRPRTTTI